MLEEALLLADDERLLLSSPAGSLLAILALAFGVVITFGVFGILCSNGPACTTPTSGLYSLEKVRRSNTVKTTFHFCLV